ncbi:hypothetical protein HPB47_025479, partial [Ixodes persulcatus]
RKSMSSSDALGLCVSQKIHWPHNVTCYLVKFYRTTPCLWDHSHRDYSDKAAKERALSQFSRETGYPVEAVRKKLINLRNQFTNEWQKMDRSRDAERPYRTKWAFYKSLTFLKDVVLPRKPRAPIHLGMGQQGQPGPVPTRVFQEGLKMSASCSAVAPGHEPAPPAGELGVDFEAPKDDCPQDDNAALVATDGGDTEDLELSQSSNSLVLSPEVTLEEPSSSERRTIQIEDEYSHQDYRMSYPFQAERYADLPRGDHIDSFTSYIGTELRRIADEEVVGGLKLQILKLIFDAQATAAPFPPHTPQ